MPNNDASARIPELEAALLMRTRRSSSSRRWRWASRSSIRDFPIPAPPSRNCATWKCEKTSCVTSCGNGSRYRNSSRAAKLFPHGRIGRFTDRRGDCLGRGLSVRSEGVFDRHYLSRVGERRMM